jgi:hypothetical protein
VVITFGAVRPFRLRPRFPLRAFFQSLIALPRVTLGNVTLAWVIMMAGIAPGMQSTLVGRAGGRLVP